MRVIVKRPDPQRLELWFEPESGDGIAPLPSVYLKGEHLSRLREGMLGTIIFLLVRDLIGNTLVLEGMEIPAYQATAFCRDFAPFDLHCAPITNIDRAIQPTLAPKTQQFFESLGGEGKANVRLRKMKYGFMISTTEKGLTEHHSYLSSISLFCSMACRRPEDVFHAIMAAVAFDLYGAVAVRDVNQAITDPDLQTLLGDNGLAFREYTA